jgi:hypothetical protein
MKRVLLVLMLVFAVLCVATYAWLRNSYDRGNLQEAIIENALPEGSQTPTTTMLIQRALGMAGSRTYLVLFLNNTELRPGGGFIGSYAVVRFTNGKPEILKVEGTESLDNLAPNVGATPTPPLAKYLGIKTWQFRDSNWSPDFRVNARLAMDLYKRENGVEADNISGVIGLTPNLFEEILKITGPVTVDGIQFTSDNFTEKLEYEVEYGYSKRGQTFSERKQLLKDLTYALLPRLITSSFTHWNDFKQLAPKMLDQKYVMLYSTIGDEKDYLASEGWDGAMQKINEGDYLLWADANLGSLKTDVVVQRSLSYGITRTATATIATASMKYNHAGGFTWRTTRYRDYVRIFVPNGSKLIGVSGATEAKGDEGDENGYHWFGAYVVVEPEHQAQLTFTYKLPGTIANQIDLGSYSLLVQKQPGTENIRLTLQLKFDKNLTHADPGETPQKFGDKEYDMVTDLSLDRQFSIQLQP